MNKLKKIAFKCVYPTIAFIMITAAVLFAFQMPRFCTAEKIIVQIEKVGKNGKCVVKTYADDKMISSVVSKGKECRFYLVNHTKKESK